MSLRVDRLTYAYGPASPVLTDIVLHLEPGERVAVFGRNGAGKSTLARCLAGWLDAHGSVTWEGRSWSERSPADRAGLVQLVDQNPRLQISGRAFTVRDEIAFGPENLCLPRDEIVERVEAALAALDLAGLAHRDPTTLSGGELQRVVLAGALAMRPRLLVLDEPSTDLDAAGCRALAAQLAALPGTTTVVILDTGPHRWLTPLIGRSFRLQATRIESRSAPCRSEGLVLPDGLNAFVEGRAAGLFGDGVPPPDDLRETVDLFRGCLP